MRLIWLLMAGLLCLAFTSCPTTDEGTDDTPLIDQEGMRGPSFEGDEGEAATEEDGGEAAEDEGDAEGAEGEDGGDEGDAEGTEGEDGEAAGDEGDSEEAGDEGDEENPGDENPCGDEHPSGGGAEHPS